MQDFTLINQLIKIGADAATLLAVEKNLRLRKFEKDDVIIHQGEYIPNVFFLSQGLVKLVYVTSEGKEFTKSFLDKGNVFGSLVSQVEGKDSTFSVVCLEPSKVEIVPYALMENLVDQDMAMLRFFCSLYKSLALKKEKREFDFLCLTPEQRYEQFLRNHPSIASRIFQAEIARYLGITPIALSRIKGRLKSVGSRDL